MEGTLRQRRVQLDQHRFEAFETWQCERLPVQNAREVLDPDNFMYHRAAQLVAERRQRQPENEVGVDPMTDLLGGARMVAASEEAGLDSTEARANHRRDIRTLFTEALLKGGHISEVETAVNAHGEADVGGLEHWRLFLRAAHIGDERARTAEIAEEFYAASLFQNLQLRDTHDLIVVSPSRPEIKGDTLMVRRIWFEKAGLSWQRKTQQLYMKGSHEGDVNQLLQEFGMRLDTQPETTAVEIVSQPLLIKRGQFGKDVAGFAEMLDTLTAERLGQPVFCGTRMPAPVERQHYRDLLAVSKVREQNIEHHITELEQVTLDLVCSQTLTFQEENQRFTDLFIASLRTICKDYPEYAEAAFGAEAARHYQASYKARQRGDITIAQHEMSQALALSTTADACETTFSLTAEGKADVSAYASLREKYGFTKLQRGACLACLQGGENQELGPCGFCNECDRNDRLRPGYIETLVKQQKKRQKSEDAPVEETRADPRVNTSLKIRHGQFFRVGEERLEFRHKIQIGGTTPIFIREDGEEIAGEAAKELYEMLALSSQLSA